MSRLSEVINRNDCIVGISCAGKIKKCCLAADDTVIGTRANAANIQEFCSVLNNFYAISGLKVNYNKSVIMRIGKKMNEQQIISIPNDFVWLKAGEKTKYLGIFVSDKYYLQENECVLILNASDIVTATQGLCYQDLSIIGRILILKSLIGSKLVYKFLHYPLPEDEVLKWLHKVYFDFVWRGRHRMSASDMVQPLEKGGFNMLSVHYQCQALQFQWLSKTLRNSNEKAVWEHYLRSCILIPLEEFLCCNFFAKSFHKLIRNIKSIPFFWLRLLHVWFKESYVRIAVINDMLNDKMISKGILFNSTCKKVSLDDAGCYKWLKDFGCFTFEEVKQVWEYLSLSDREKILNMFRRNCRQAIHDYFNDLVFTSGECSMVSILLQPHTRTKQIYMALRDKHFALPTDKISKWETDLNIQIGNEWSLICKRILSIYNSRLRAFHVQFLHRAFHLNRI